MHLLGHNLGLNSGLRLGRKDKPWCEGGKTWKI